MKRQLRKILRRGPPGKPLPEGIAGIRAQNIQFYRKVARGLPAPECARRAGISRIHWYRAEQGGPMRDEVLGRIAQVLGVKLIDLYHNPPHPLPDYGPSVRTARVNARVIRLRKAEAAQRRRNRKAKRKAEVENAAV